MSRRPSGRSEAGTTLIELLVAVAIMGIAFVTILGGIGTAIIGSDIQKRDATGGVVLTSAAEKIVADSMPYKPCAAPADYQDPAYLDPTFTRGGYRVEVTEVDFWDGGSGYVPLPVPPPAACGDADNGIQLIKLQLIPPPGPRAGATELLEVAKRQVANS